MKTFITLTILMISAQLTFAQLASSAKKSEDAVSEMPAEFGAKAKVMTNTAAVRELSQHLQQTLVVPQRMIDYKVSGKSLVNVEINEEGQISDIEIVKSLGKSMDKAIIRSLKSVKKVKSVVINGKAKAQIIQLPVIIK